MQIFDIPVGPGNRETTKPGPAFPLGVYCSTLSRNVLGYTPLHWNDELQFCAVTKGRVLFSVNENKYLLETGDGIFINSGYLHMARPVGNPDSTYICLDVGKAMLAAWPGSILESRYLLPALKAPELACLLLRASVPWQQEALERIRTIYTLTETRPYGYELEVTALLLQLFLSILRHRPGKCSTVQRSRSNLAVQHILTYIGEHYTEKISLDELSAFASYTRGECCRLFKRYTGESIFSYLRKFRLEKSLSALVQTEMPISQIAYDCGFSSTSYYIDQFRKQFGRTPLQYRKEHDPDRRRSLPVPPEDPSLPPDAL